MSKEKTAEMGSIVWVAIYEHRHGTDVCVFNSEEAALAWRDSIAEDYWDYEIGNAITKPESNIGETYFDLMFGSPSSEYFRWYQHRVLGVADGELS